MLKRDGEIQSKLRSKHRERRPRRNVDRRKTKLWEHDQCYRGAKASEKSKLTEKKRMRRSHKLHLPRWNIKRRYCFKCKSRAGDYGRQLTQTWNSDSFAPVKTDIPFGRVPSVVYWVNIGRDCAVVPFICASVSEMTLCFNGVGSNRILW